MALLDAECTDPAAVILESQHGLGKHVSQHQCMGPVLQALKTLTQSRHFTMPGTTYTSRYLDTTPESSPTSQVIRSTSSAPFHNLVYKNNPILIFS